MKNLKSLFRLIPYLKTYKAGLILGVVFVILAVFFTTKVPRVMGDAIDVLGESFDNSMLFDNVVLLLIYAAVQGIFRFLMRNTMIGISRKIEFDIRNDFFKHLPSIVDGERIEILFLIVAFTCLTLALLTGMSLEYYESGKIFVLNHKNLFSYFTFLVIAILFAYRKLKGARGKRAARIVLLSYLFLTLAYPGVKFVQFVLIS